jgi:hypothetical protein
MRGKEDPERSLDRFIEAYTPEVAAIARAALARLRKLLPGAVELVYDNYNALAIAFGPSERTSEAIVSLALYPRWVSVFFVRGASLPDPARILRGNGKAMRHVVLQEASDLDAPALRALVGAAVGASPVPLDRKAARRTIVKSVSPKQRPRRPS